MRRVFYGCEAGGYHPAAHINQAREGLLEMCAARQAPHLGSTNNCTGTGPNTGAFSPNMPCAAPSGMYEVGQMRGQAGIGTPFTGFLKVFPPFLLRVDLLFEDRNVRPGYARLETGETKAQARSV
jgi:hypothetical protein